MKKKLFFMLVSAFALCVSFTACDKDDDPSPADDAKDLATDIDKTPENETDNAQLVGMNWNLTGATGTYREYGYDQEAEGTEDDPKKWDETTEVEDKYHVPFEWNALCFRANKKVYTDYWTAQDGRTDEAFDYVYKDGTLTIVFENDEYTETETDDNDKEYTNHIKEIETATGKWTENGNTATWVCKYTSIDEETKATDNVTASLTLTFTKQQESDEQ